jgi:integrase
MGWIKGPRGRWEGGRIWEDANGRRTFVIRRMIGGKPYEVSTRCDRERPALAQLDRFLADPENYDPRGGSAEPLRLTADLVRAFIAWSLDTKGNSRPWVLQQKAYLAWWAEKLKGRDLRALDLGAHVIPALDSAPERRHRIEVLKAFCSWLRKERHLLSRADDATLDLTVAARRPEQWKRPKAIPRAHYLRALAALEPRHRDALTVLDETGWHVSELVRFVRAGSIVAVPPGRDEAAILEVRHKSGEPHRTAVGFRAWKAAARLRERGVFSVGRFYEAIKAACVRAKVPPFTVGRFRHTVATRHVEQGADPAAVATYLGHKSPSTLRRFYSTLAVPPRPKPRP